MGTLPWRYLLHADLDAFFASVEQHDNPPLQGKPVVVGGPPEQRGVVAAASYEVRTYGVRSAMPMRTALRLCPQAIRVSPRFQRYHEVSEQVMALFHRLTPLVEPLSLDEAYLDISEQVPPGEVLRAARRLKEAVRQEVGLAITVGGGTTKTVAKVASELAKPDGLMLIAPGEEPTFLAPLPVDRLPGVGPRTAHLLRSHGVQTIGQLATADPRWLRDTLGRRGLEVRLKAQGRDRAPVVPSRESKEASAETSLAEDESRADVLVALMTTLAQRVARRLRDEGLRGRTVGIKLRLADFTTFTRQTTLPLPTDRPEEIAAAALDLLRRELHPGRRFRLVGVAVGQLQRTYQLPLLPPDA